MIQTLVCAGFLVAVISLGTSSVAVGQTQTEMNEEAGTRLRTAEAELKKVIEELESKARGKSKALEALRNGQVAWENYRDAQLRALWPFPESTSYGSVHPMCVADTKAEMTRVRTRELRAMMKPTEGDACSSQWPD